MGLDQYLSKKHYIGAHYEHRKITGEINIKEDGEPLDINFNQVSEITERVGYWRKANQIHQWFVQNVQDGVDECQESWVPNDDIKELLALCEIVVSALDDNNMITIEKKDTWSDKPYTVEVYANQDEVIDLLPTSQGFFFGDDNIDKYYKQDLQDTIEILTPLVDCDQIYYQASW